MIEAKAQHGRAFVGYFSILILKIKIGSALSHGIPGVTIGVVNGGGAHTRQEWIEIDSLPKGARLAAGVLSQYFKEF